MLGRKLITSWKEPLYKLIPARLLVRKFYQEDKVFLTFDDGPHSKNTPVILDILHEHAAKATFFIVGREAKKHPEIVRRIFNEGHGVAGHGWSHRKLPQWAFRDVWIEFDRTNGAIRDAIGVTTIFFRPPFGYVTFPMLAYAAVNRMKIILWSVDSNDDFSRSATTILVKGRQVRGGDIILCHDDNDSILEALPTLLREWQARGLQPCAFGDDGR
jgi:peptidoglycan/xylan/chitin deacetylase (PgdA/CDA1 family)